jgi:predicted DNA-binding antitoxin AbrB/MazE fold protein
MDKQVIEAVFQDGAFRPIQPVDFPISEGQHVRLSIEPGGPTKSPLDLLTSLYDGLSEQEIDEIEKIILDRRPFFGPREMP